MIHNIIQNATSVRNDTTCMHDSHYAYDCTFPTNGDVAGWDVYSGIYLYGSWNKVLFGSSTGTSCYIGNTDNINPITAETFYNFYLMMKLTAPDNPYKSFPTTGTLQWITSTDDTWDDDKSVDFDLVESDTWQLYTINLAELQYWAGSILNLRITPFSDGYSDIQFAIKYIRVGSDTEYTCTNTDCSYYTSYSHPCGGVGSFSTAESNVASTHYTTQSGVSDTLRVNIDGYGDEEIHLGTHNNITGNAMAKVIENRLSRLDIGSYAYATVDFTEDNTLKITAGNVGSDVDSALISSSAELSIYVIAYAVSDTFLTKASSLGVTVNNAVTYLYIISGDAVDILQLFFPNDDTNDLSSLSEILTAAGYFTTILSIRASSTLYSAQIYQKDVTPTYSLNCYSYITYDSSNALKIAASMYDYSSGDYTGNYLEDSTNEVVLLEDPETNMFDDSPELFEVSSKSLTMHLLYAEASVMIWSMGEDNEPSISFTGCDSRVATIETIEEVTSSWFNDWFSSLQVNLYNSVAITGGTAAEALGFLDSDGNSTYTQTKGTAPADGFDYTSSKRLRTFEIANLIDNDLSTAGLVHNPDAYVVSAGRSDYCESSTANSAGTYDDADYYTTINGESSILIDFSHPVNDCGLLEVVYFNGTLYDDLTASVIVFRPNKNRELIALTEVEVTEENTTSVYSTDVVTQKVELSLFVSKGDVIGFKNVALKCPFSSITNLPNATIYKVSSDTDTTAYFDPGTVISQGVIGPSYYAHGTRTQSNIALTIDMGKRLNIDKISLYGEETGDYFEYNLAACLDVEWECELYDGTHHHSAVNDNNSITYTWTHNNLAFGLDSLNDCSVTVDGGQEGTSYTKDSNGINTYGTHTYFYVNGDAEWLYSTDGDRTEFAYPYIDVTTTDFIYDPVSIYLSIPNNKTADLYKSSIYFKESSNFKKMGISYYMGPNSDVGNAEGDGYQYIEDINYVAIDGVKYYPDDAGGDTVTIADYITPNPMPSAILTYVDDEATNWGLYQVAGNTEWNILTHDFEPVTAYGFQIYCNWHVSTKIVEIELYSRFAVTPTLVDNISVRSSIYGDTWDLLTFQEDSSDSNIVYADVNSAPRYFEIDIAPQSESTLSELLFTTNDNALSTLKCDNTILPSFAPNGQMSSISEIEIENTYDIPLNLYVNVPMNVVNTSSLLSWIKLSSDDTIKYAEVGPGAIVSKNDDYPVVLHNNQIAISTPAYYLQNLIDGKSAYAYEKNASWGLYGTLSAGEEINYTNDSDSMIYTTSFDSVGSKYWKLFFGDHSITTLYSLSLYSDSVEITPSNVWIQGNFGSSSKNKIPATFDKYGVFTSTTLLEDDFSDSSYLTEWEHDISLFSYFTGGDYALEPTTLFSGTSDSTFTRSLDYDANSFESIIDFTMNPADPMYLYTIKFTFLNSVGQELLQATLESEFYNVTTTIQSYNQNVDFDPEGTEYEEYTSETISKSDLAAIDGKLRLNITKTGNSLDSVSITSRDESTTFLSYTTTSAYFSSRISAFSVNFSSNNDWIIPADIPDRETFYVKTFVLDVYSSYQVDYSTSTGNLYAGIRSIEFFDASGTRYSLSSSAFSASATYQFSSMYSAYNIFYTSYSKTGGSSGVSWMATNPAVPCRIYCMFTDTLAISRIYINNFHESGGNVSRGVKYVKAYVTEKNYSSTVFEEDIPGGQLIFDGIIPEHVESNEVDNYQILISGTEPISTDVLSDDTYLAINSVTVNALPILERRESLVFGFDSVTALDQIDLSIDTQPTGQSLVYISSKENDDYTVWARNDYRFLMSASTDRTFLTSDYLASYKYWSSMAAQDFAPYLSMYSGYFAAVSYVTREKSWLGNGVLPQWIVYDFGAGNECNITCMCVWYDSIGTYDFPTTVQVYGSNDTNPDWSANSKTFLYQKDDITSSDVDTYCFNHSGNYRYYCLYFPNLDGSTDNYSFGLYLWYLYTDIAFKGLPIAAYYGSTSVSTDISALTNATDLITQAYEYLYSNSAYVYIDFSETVPISGYKILLYNSSGYSDLVKNRTVWYSTASGIDGDWIEIEDFFDDLEAPSSYDCWTFPVYFETPIEVRWLRFSSYYLRYTYSWSFIVGEPSSNLYQSTSTYNNYFAIDLSDSYYLDFMRSYGDNTDNVSLFDLDVAISNTDSSDPSDVVWDSSYVVNEETEARWIRIPMLCGDGTDRNIQYLGIYPNTSKAYRPNGGYNCTWNSIGTALADYYFTYNVAGEGDIIPHGAEILSNVKTVILDIANNHDSNMHISIRSVDFYDASGDIITLSTDDLSAYATSTFISSDDSYVASNAFDNTLSKTGTWSATSWVSSLYSDTEQRLICVFNDPVALSKIVINNGHDSGYSTAAGAATTSIYALSYEVTNTTYGVAIEDALELFSGDIDEHSSEDVEDDYSIDLTTIDTTTPYCFGWSPARCIQGDSSLSGYSNCWAFVTTDTEPNPTCVIDLTTARFINKFILTHCYEDTDTDTWENNDFTIYGKETANDAYTALVTVTDNTSSVTEHILDDVAYIRYVMIQITDFTKPDDPVRVYDTTTGDYTQFSGGFLREIEMWLNTGSTLIDSENYPVVCMNLLQAYDITSHKLLNYSDDYSDNTWDNDDDYFKYSDNVANDPKYVSFLDATGDNTIFTLTSSVMDYLESQYTLSVATSLYLSEGYYTMSWQTYGAEFEEAIYIQFSGPQVIKCYSENISDGWTTQTSTFNITANEEGTYTVYAKREADDLSIWGVNTITLIRGSSSNTKWILAKRDTATNYSWDNTSDSYGPDYLSRIEVYANGTFYPTQCYWWWTSTVSTLSNSADVKIGSRSLRVDYPTSSGVDRLDFVEGDHFGWDEYWSVKDTLSFWWYISDIDKLYLDEGGFGFGNFAEHDSETYTDHLGDDEDIGAEISYYTWDFSEMDLHSGWNEMKLQFDENTLTCPLTSSTTGLLEDELNFRQSIMSSFGVVYKGIGESFYMLFDGFTIERNWYNDVVYDDLNGLCLTWQEYAEIPLAGLTLNKGTIEFRVKFYTSTEGLDCFGDSMSRPLFSITNNNDDVICLSLKSAGWFEVGFGGARYDFNTLTVDPYEYNISDVCFDIGESAHIAVVWSNDGTGMSDDSTIRLYINGNLVVYAETTWDVGDAKSAILRLGGGTTILANNNDEEGSAIFSNLVVYSDCKESFDVNNSTPAETSDVEANSLLQVSKDGVNFYDYNSGELPLEYTEVPVGDKVKVYTRVDKTKMDESSGETGTLEVEWQVIV